jgi:hypothetical protein
MKKVRWFGVTWPFSMWTLAKHLKRLSFEDARAVGFIVDRTREDSIEARFFERVSFTETVRDPRGTEYQYERVSFSVLQFRCSPQFPQLEIIDAPRSTKSFMNLLSEATSFEISIDTPTVNLELWLTELQKRFPDDFLCDAVRVAEFPVSDSSRARVAFSSSKDVREDARKFLSTQRITFDKAQVRLRFLGEQASLSLSPDGAIRSEKEITIELANAVRDAFIASWDSELLS